jgi:hypothetical protein
MNIKVSIPVELGGYTGQLDRWESLTRDYIVSIDDDSRVKLEDASPGVRRTIWFDLDDLNEAIRFVKEKEVS